MKLARSFVALSACFSLSALALDKEQVVLSGGRHGQINPVNVAIIGKSDFMSAINLASC